MKREVRCEKCKQPIIYREDLVSEFILFILRPFHEDCYAKQLKKSYVAFFMNGLPINSLLWTANAMIGTPIGLLFLIFASGDARWIGLLFLVPVIYRALAYVLYEKNLKE